MPQPIVEQFDNFPPDGQLVHVRGLVSTDYIKRGQRLPVEWSPFWESMTRLGYVRPVDDGLVPDSREVFPTVAHVAEMISLGATTLPGQRILGVRGDAEGIWVRTGTSEESSREHRVDWPDLDEVIGEINEIRDEVRAYAEDVAGVLAAEVQGLRDELVVLNGIAAAAAQIALNEAQRVVDAAQGAGTLMGDITDEEDGPW